MVTGELKVDASGKSIKGDYSLKCLSSDTKPTTFDNQPIRNGSSLMEMDTKTLYYFDEAGQQWV